MSRVLTANHEMLVVFHRSHVISPGHWVKLLRELKEETARLMMSAVLSSPNQLEGSTLHPPFSRGSEKYQHENFQFSPSVLLGLH